MAYSSITKPSDYFNTVLYTGDGTSPKSITGVGFQPDWVWVKKRSGTTPHVLYDAVRGAGKQLMSDAADAEATNNQYGYVSDFLTDGYQVTQGSTNISRVNASSATFAAWNWLGANGTVSNGDGSITSTVSANTTSGFSIVKYTGTGANATIGHGLGVAPKMIIVKAYEGGQQWAVQHSALGATKGIRINTTAAAYTSSTRWNNTEPTSSVFTVGTEAEVNTNTEDHIAYCFAEKKGYSKFGSYTGNGNADGTFVYTGFRPAWVLTKASSRTGRWRIWDNKRSTFNVADKRLDPSSSDAESTDDSTEVIDILSNGFKIRTSESQFNGSGETNIFMAFAENPFVANDSGTAVPVVAR
jgi:hypothetical protein